MGEYKITRAAIDTVEFTRTRPEIGEMQLGEVLGALEIAKLSIIEAWRDALTRSAAEAGGDDE